jgi:hypothetical protein
MLQPSCERCQLILKQYRAATAELLQASLRVVEAAGEQPDVIDRALQEAQRLNEECTRLYDQFLLHANNHSDESDNG